MGQSDPRAGKVNGLQRPSPVRGRRFRAPKRHPLSLVAAGATLYGVSLAIPVFLRQVSPVVFASAVAGTLVLLLGLHVRWTREGAPA